MKSVIMVRLDPCQAVMQPNSSKCIHACFSYLQPIVNLGVVTRYQSVGSLPLEQLSQ